MAEGEPRQGGAAQDPFEMFRRLWAPLGLPVPGMAMPTLDPAEIEKRISDLKSVETWLGMNLNMVKVAIQGLEVQKMALSAMHANAGAASDAASAFANFARAAAAADPSAAGEKDGSSGEPAGNLANPMLWPWAMMQGTATPGTPPDNPGSSHTERTGPASKRGSDSRKEEK